MSKTVDAKLPGPEAISAILRILTIMVAPGIKTSTLDAQAEVLIQQFGCKSVNKGYYPKWALIPYPNVLVTNVNNVIVHGLPNDEPLQEGDIISIDLGIIDSYGNAADAAITVPVGQISDRKKRLLYYAYQTMMVGVNEIKVGANTETIARMIETYASIRGYKVNQRFGGHAIGKEMHEKPHIYNSIQPPNQDYALIEEGKIYCIEPLITCGGDNKGMADGNGWTYRTVDGQPSAFFEVMVKATKDGPVILTDHIDQPIL